MSGRILACRIRHSVRSIDSEEGMIHSFRVRNYMSIIDVSVDLAPVTVLVGKSGTGKSNFVHSLRLLRDLLSSPQQVHVLQMNWARLTPATSSNAPTAFEVAFTIAGIEEEF